MNPEGRTCWRKSLIKLQDMEAQGPVTSTAMFPVFESYRVVSTLTIRCWRWPL
jgi:hypothetical protein